MDHYYSDKLSADRLRRCYEIAPPRVQQYLRAEIDYVIGLLHPGDSVLELGCGYGRVLEALTDTDRHVFGLDTCIASLKMARASWRARDTVHLAQMDAAATGFSGHAFDVVACIQNGISAFHVDQRQLIEEAVRITRPGGLVLFSTYAQQFWDHRLNWFELQADAGLLGAIDYDATGDGVIVCKDGFVATTVIPDDFMTLMDGLQAKVTLTEVDGSSLFCEIVIDNIPHT